MQCESCTSQLLANGRIEALNGTGVFYVFSLDSGIVFKVRRSGEIPENPSPSIEDDEPVEAAVLEAFSHLLQAYQEDSQGFYNKSTFIAPIDAIGGNHDPVGISLAGEHSGHFSSFLNGFDHCVTTISCMQGISLSIAALMRAEERFRLNGLTLGPFGATVSWEQIPAQISPNINLKIFLCDSHANCIKMELVNGSWVYRGVYAAQGNGPRYPQPGEDLTYDSNDQGFESLFLGLRGAGVDVGEWLFEHFTLRCAYVNGRLDRCEMVPRDSM